MSSIIERLFSLSGRVAIVTGGTSGVGRMIAEGLVAAGAKTYVVSRKADACSATAQELSSAGSCIALPGDIGTQAGCQAIAEGFRAEGETRLHILVNAAGVTWGAPIRDYPDVAWDKVLGANLKGPFNLTVALLDELEAGSESENPAKVINIGSVHGLFPPEYESYAYAASKAGVHHLTRHLAKTLGPRRIAVNAIAPGPFPSRMMKAMIEQQGGQLASECATGRLGEPDDVAGAAIYLASRAAANVTGVVLPVDGGYGTTR